MKRLKQIIIPLALPALIFICWSNSSFLELADFAWRDLLYTLRPPQTRVDDVIIVAIDEPSFQQIKLRWPWPRSLHAKIVEQLSSAGAAAIAFDVLFPEKSYDTSEDITFAEAIRKAGNVVLASNLTITGRHGYETYFVEEPIPHLAEAASAVGMVNLYPDGDGTIRMASNYVDILPSIAFAAVTTAFNRDKVGKVLPFEKNHPEKEHQRELLISLREIEQKGADQQEIFFIDYAGKAGTVPAVSYYQVINNMVNPALFKDKIVFVGFLTDSAVEVEGGADSYPYPFMRFTKKMISGVEIQSNVARTILRGFPIDEFNMQAVKWLCFYLLASILITVRKHPLYLTLLAVTIPLLEASTSIIMFRYQDTVLDVMAAIAGVALNGIYLGIKEFSENYKEKSMLRKAFDSYVSPDVVASVIANHENLKLGGERRRLSVLFSDIRGFTTLSEKLAPEELVSLLNNYFTQMTDIIFSHNGTLDKYIGDAIMVIFGAPVWSDDHAQSCCYTALEMRARLEEMNLENSKVPNSKVQGSGIVTANSTSAAPIFHPIAIGIGINTGDMIVGNMGSLRRFDYTVMGDEVNLASRLEGVTKIYNVQIIISEETKNDLDREKFLYRELDLIKVKGKYRAIKIYELISTSPASESDIACVNIFSQALQVYREKRWDDAIELFRKALKYRDGDGPSELFIKRCEMFKKNPPVAAGQEWDGVWIMSTK